jgi:ammonia channel protein AmtB
MQNLVVFSLVAVLWALYGYSSRSPRAMPSSAAPIGLFGAGP